MTKMRFVGICKKCGQEIWVNWLTEVKEPYCYRCCPEAHEKNNTGR